MKKLLSLFILLSVAMPLALHAGKKENNLEKTNKKKTEPTYKEVFKKIKQIKKSRSYNKRIKKIGKIGFNIKNNKSVKLSHFVSKSFPIKRTDHNGLRRVSKVLIFNEESDNEESNNHNITENNHTDEENEDEELEQEESNGCNPNNSFRKFNDNDDNDNEDENSSFLNNVAPIEA